MSNPTYEKWTDRDFKKLSQLIQDSTKTVISPDTLKRLFGKVKYNLSYNPQVATKEALAKFLGYDSWDNFVIINKGNVNQNINTSQSSIRKKPGSKNFLKYKSLIIIPLAFTGGILLLWFIYNILTLSSDKYSISVNEMSGIVPHTVAFNLRFDQPVPKNLFIDFDFTHPFVDDNPYKILNDDDTVYYYTYEIPGVYRPVLKTGNKIIQTELVIAKSNDWVGFYTIKQERYTYWLNNMVNNLQLNKPMTLTREDINIRGGDTLDVYYTTFRNIRDFNISGDNFIFETTLKNGPETGGMTCFDSNITLICENNYASLRFLEPNCYAWARFKFSEKELMGTHVDLSALIIDPLEWMNIRIENINKRVRIYINGEEAFSESYQKDMGNLYGLEYRFKGSGLVKSILVKTPEDEIVYEEMFN